MLAKYIILDTREAIMEFESFLVTVPIFGLNTQECVYGVYSQLIHQMECRGDVCDYIDEMMQAYASCVEYNMVEEFASQLEELARSIWEKMVTWGVFGKYQFNLYELDRFHGYDLVLSLNEEMLQELLDEEKANEEYEERLMTDAKDALNQMVFDFI